MPTELQHQWVRKVLGVSANVRLSGPSTQSAKAGTTAGPLKVRIGYPHPPTQDLGEPKDGPPEVELGGAEIVEQTLGEPVRGPKRNTLYALLNQAGTGRADTPVALKLNADGKAVQAQFTEISKLEAEWTNKIDAIKKNAGKGRAALKQVQDAAASIGAHARGPEGQYLRTAIEAYRDAVKNAEQQVREIGAKLQAYKIAQDDMVVKDLQGQVQVQNRQVNKDEKEVKEEEKKVEEQKKRIETFFEIAAHMVEPDKWATLAVAAVGCVGEQLLEENEVSTSHLDELRRKLAESQKQLETLQDVTQLKDMETAGEKVALASYNVETAREAFTKFSEDVQLKETTVVEAMKKSSTTKQAGQVIAKREEITKTAAQAEVLLQQYLKQTDPFIKKMTALAERYRGYHDLANRESRGDLAAVADRNDLALVDFSKWIEDMRALARQGVAYLTNAKDEYFAGYSDIPDVLTTALVGRDKN